ncbi:pyrroloquinoline quinone precursor peptide PqqA [Pseudonocardia sp. KRD-184]|jgi:coenzyme PQQ precursor peptide PqqA|uniref:Coenzyme PQQ synthesis protein A n=1 Tax=Pseudonocardia oceani TaxID=2792013 RepID=A0ABS6UH61_9PSEU|nr:pyrroloquinoline quinone precursor peptide PqqA [Pseudonocardia oceani]MBW0090971.1 pyrroloquinoline quinone precursor peptide PqqA [Pseudonocardia oceani]MBW0096257.1 pyrroloquinoline quinone precursor peptide PqqA [Pseudonocardia oceani]MBW0109856.1 pyrroloquinoline quinone precursor peptide PqqA [Pseudonocardia oceani]MBW0120136.1 pyrroloquinoline quinone precursor peptide PqqA [Pseudonocardia oceani]MBW0131556.1 pyrroloquinoline quinone precursor peptide PqqA [Pseudonocardia oceani]
MERLAEWEAPDFDEVGCAPEVTMYIARSEA